MGVLNIYNELGKAQFERLSAAPSQLQGRFFFDVVAIKAYLGDGTAYREFLLNTDPLVLGLSGTAANNVRLYTTAPGTLTLLKGSETATPPVTPTNYANLTSFLEACQVTTSLYFSQVTPVTPAATVLGLYQKTDGYLYTRDSAGTEWPVISKEVPTYLTWVQTTTPSNPSASRFRTYFKSDGYLYSLDSAGLERRIGSGGGSGINYITNSDIESAITGYNAYDDSASGGVAPINGTGGSPTVTATRSTSSPLIGTASGIFTKPAGDDQGQGMSYDIAIDSAFQARQLVVSFEYQTSANYVAGDILMYVYDITNATVTQLAPYSLLKSDNGAATFTATFQAASNSTSYRICWHVATTNANAYTVKFDNVIVSPSTVAWAAPVTDPTVYTPALNSNTGVSANAARWWRDGKYMMIEGTVVYSGAGAAGSFTISLPSGYSADTTSAPLGSGSNPQQIVGFWGWFDNAGSAASRGGFVRCATAATEFTFCRNDTSNSVDSSAFAASDYISYQLRVPILGWGSNVQVGGYDGRTVACRYTSATTALSAVLATLVFPTVDFDTHGAFDSTTGIFTAPVAGYYQTSCTIATNSVAWTLGNLISLNVTQNGTGTTVYSTQKRLGTYSASENFTASTVLYLEAGETLRWRSNTTPSVSLSGNANTNTVEFALVPGRSTLSSGDTVAFAATKASGSAANGSADVTSYTTEFDLTGSFNATTGIFTAPIAGTYSGDACVSYAANATGSRGMVLQVNGVDVRNGPRIPATAANDVGVALGFTLRLAAGDTVKVRSNQTSGAGLNFSTATAATSFSIRRVGN